MYYFDSMSPRPARLKSLLWAMLAAPIFAASVAAAEPTAGAAAGEKANLTLDHSTALVHYGPDQTQRYVLVRIKQPDQPKNAGSADGEPKIVRDASFGSDGDWKRLFLATICTPMKGKVTRCVTATD